MQRELLRRLADSRVNMAEVAVSVLPTRANEARYHEALAQAANYWRASMTREQAESELAAAELEFGAARAAVSLLDDSETLERNSLREDRAKDELEMAELRYRAVCRDLGACIRRTLPHVYAGRATA